MKTTPFLVLAYVDVYAVERKWNLIGDTAFNKAVTDTISYARKSTKALPALREIKGETSRANTRLRSRASVC